MSSNGDDPRKVNSAQNYCLENWEWMLQQCRSYLKSKRVPNYIDLAKDLSQSVFVQFAVVENERWNEVKNRPGYVYKALKHAANGHYFKTWREEPVDPSDFMNALDKQGQHAADTETVARQVRELLARCTNEERILFELLFEGFSTKEIAVKFGISESAVRQRIVRLNRKLQQLLRSDKDPP